MFKTIFIIFIIMFLVVLKINKVHIKWKTFTKKGFKVKRGDFGIYCYCGKQGNFKTYSMVDFLYEHRDMEIYSNIKSINSEIIPYTYFCGFKELLKLQDKTDCIIVYDEIFTALTKGSKIDTEVLSFLSQMRKRRIILLTSAQEWLEINITLRRYCRYQIVCNFVNLGFINLIVKKFNDAENMKWSNDDNEYVAPLLETTISKPNLFISNLYDTFEQIATEEKK